MHQRVLVQIAEQLPGNLDSLIAIKGIGTHTANEYGDQLIAMVCDYCRDLAIEPEQITPSPKKKKRDVKATKQISLEFFLQGKSIQEIATERGLVTSTIEGHLAHYVTLGELELEEILPAEKITVIKQAFDETDNIGLKAIKEQLGDEYSYGEIKLVLASLEAEAR